MERNLLQYKKIAESYGFPTEYHQKQDNLDFDYLVLNLFGKMTLYVRESEENLLFPLSNIAGSTESVVHIHTILPFIVKDNALLDTARAINFINKGLEAPGFILDEINHLIYYRYMFLKSGGMINENTFLSILGMITLYLDCYSKMIERVANGEEINKVITSSLNELAG